MTPLNLDAMVMPPLVVDRTWTKVWTRQTICTLPGHRASLMTMTSLLSVSLTRSSRSLGVSFCKICSNALRSAHQIWWDRSGPTILTLAVERSRMAPVMQHGMVSGIRWFPIGSYLLLLLWDNESRMTLGKVRII